MNDIEEYLETTKDASFNNSGLMKVSDAPSVTASIAASRTSKSGGGSSVVFSVDRSVLQLLSAVEDAEHNHHEDHPEDRVKDPCFGSCCDLVRACIYIDTFYIFKNIQVIITILLGLSVVDPDDFDLRDFDDDDFQAEVGQYDVLFWILIAKNICGILFASIGILGAWKYNKVLVFVVAFWCCIDLVWSVLTARPIAAVVVAFFIYPHIALFLALKNAKITPDNYESSVDYCCCSNRKCCRNCGSGGGSNTTNDAGTATASATATTRQSKSTATVKSESSKSMTSHKNFESPRPVAAPSASRSKPSQPVMARSA